MLIANLYHPIFLFIVTIFTVIYYFKYKTRNDGLVSNRANDKDIKTLLVAIFMTLFIGFRPESGKFVDMMNYVAEYHFFWEGSPFSFDWGVENILFDNYFAWVGSKRLGTTFLFVTIAAVYFLGTYAACKKMFPKDMFVSYLVFLGAMSTFSYSTNGIKAGAAAAVFLLALSYYKHWKWFLLFLLASYGMHHSMQLPVAACVLALFIKNSKFYLVIWFLCILISAAHITTFQEIFANLSADTLNDVHGASYLQNVDVEWGGKTGFRYDFVLYSAMPVLVGYYAIIKKKLRLSETYTYLLNVYLITNSIWMLCMYANFTNRIAYLSWLMYPVLLTFPFLNENWGAMRYQTFAKVMLAHFGFTLFMAFIYN